MICAYRVEMTETGSEKSLPDGYMYSFNASALRDAVKKREKSYIPGYTLSGGETEVVAVDRDFHLELLQSVVVTTYIGKHSGDISKL